MIYRLAAALCEEWFPIRFRWYRSAPADAAIALPDGRTLAIVRCGRTADRTGFARRVGRLRDGPAFSAALLVMPDEVRLRHARRLVASLPFVCFLALERHAATASAESRIWRVPSGASAMSLTTALGLVRGRGSWGREPTRQRRSPPRSPDHEAGESDWMLSSRLKPAEKRTLDLLADWPWLAPGDLESLLGVGRRRVSALTADLQRRGLGHRAEVGRPPPVGAHGPRPDLARPSRPNIARGRPQALERVPARRGRAAGVAQHLGRPNAAAAPPPGPHRGGARIRGAAGLAGSLDRTGTWRNSIRPSGPPATSAYRGRLHSIQPDAFGLLRGSDRYLPFFLEWERRAIRPKTMAARLAPYLRYFEGRRPLDDHGAVPLPAGRVRAGPAREPVHGGRPP